MSAVVQALEAASTASVRISRDGDKLILEAPVEPPADVLQAVVAHKAEILSLLSHAGTVWDAIDVQVEFEERAAIMEFDGGLSRAEAERSALESAPAKTR